jgi:hypothetical protein
MALKVFITGFSDKKDVPTFLEFHIMSSTSFLPFATLCLWSQFGGRLVSHLQVGFCLFGNDEDFLKFE